MPITLWSRLKMYFRMKPCGAACAAWAAGEDIKITSGKRSLLGLLDLPLLEIRFAHHLHGGAHLEMAQPAELRARHFVGADLVGLEVQRNFHAGDDILLHPQLPHEEVVDDVARMQDELDVPAGGHLERGAHDVVLGRGVLVVEAERVAGGIIDEFEIGAAEFAVRPGIAKIPGELLGHDLDRDRIRRHFVEMHARPDLGAHHDEAEEEDGRGAGPKRFELVVAVRITGAAAAIAEADDDVSQRELRQKKDYAHHHQGAHELRVISDSVLVNGRWKPPGPGRKKINDNGGEDPNDRSE